MKIHLIIVCLLILISGCVDKKKDVTISNGFAPKDAPERAQLPDKCKKSKTFDSECAAIFDKIWGDGAGANELITLRHTEAYSSEKAFKKSTVEPVKRLGD